MYSEVDNQEKIKKLLDCIFGCDVLNIIEKKYPKLNNNLEILREIFYIFVIDCVYGDEEIQLILAKKIFQIMNLEDERNSLNVLKDKFSSLKEAKINLLGKIETTKKAMQNNVFDMLDINIKIIKNQFNDIYKEIKNQEKILNSVGFTSSLTEESIDQIKNEISQKKRNISDLKISLEYFEDINDEQDLRNKIDELNLELNEWKNYFNLEN